jgi:hypothetical protein
MNRKLSLAKVVQLYLGHSLLSWPSSTHGMVVDPVFLFFGSEFSQLGDFFSENENKHEKLVIFSLMTR